jgi:hypothetical protein
VVLHSPDLMPNDVCDLVRRDHEDIERAVTEMVDPHRSPTELAESLDTLRLELAVHVASQAKVFDALRAHGRDLGIMRLVAMQEHDDHVGQRNAVHELLRTRPASLAWYELALHLRISILDHDFRADQDVWTMREHVSPELRAQLAELYATQRMLVVTSTSPYRIVEQRVLAEAVRRASH